MEVSAKKNSSKNIQDNILLANDVRRLISSLSDQVFDVVWDCQPILQSEVILIDDRRQHWEIEIKDSGSIRLLHQKYLGTGELDDVGDTDVISLDQIKQALSL